MNRQQAEIELLLGRAADQFVEDGVVDAVLQTDLAAEGYVLRNLTRDMERLAARKETY